MITQQGATTTMVATAPPPFQPTIVQPLQRTLKTTTIKGLGITNIVLGLISIGMGIGTAVSLHNYWVSSLSGGIWCGIWFVITGILGVALSSNPTNGCLVGTTMAFNIISTILAGIDGILFFVGMLYTMNCDLDYDPYSDYDASILSHVLCGGLKKDLGTAFFATQMSLMGAEFFVALIAAVYCCSGCCRHQTPPAITMQQQPSYQVVTSSMAQHLPVSSHSGYTSVPQEYPIIQTHPGGAPHIYQTSTQPQYFKQPGYGPAYTTQTPMQVATTNIAYSVQQTHEKASLMENQENEFADNVLPPNYQH